MVTLHLIIELWVQLIMFYSLKQIWNLETLKIPCIYYDIYMYIANKLILLKLTWLYWIVKRVYCLYAVFLSVELLVLWGNRWQNTEISLSNNNSTRGPLQPFRFTEDSSSKLFIVEV